MELRQAIVAMMNRKDELEEQNTYVRCCHYMLHTNTQYSHLNWKTISNDPFVLIVSADFFFCFFFYTGIFFLLTWGQETALKRFILSNQPLEMVIYPYLRAAVKDHEASSIVFCFNDQKTPLCDL